jgi:hypothetical protein
MGMLKNGSDCALVLYVAPTETYFLIEDINALEKDKWGKVCILQEETCFR